MTIIEAAAMNTDAATPKPRLSGFAGIDPGLSGFMVRLSDDGRIVDAVATPSYSVKGSKRIYDIPGMLEIARSLRGVALVVIEKQQAIPKQGGVSNYTTGYGYGLWRMALASAGLPVQEVSPRKWKNAIGVTIEREAVPEGATDQERARTQNKNRKALKGVSVARAQALYPDFDLRISDRARTPSPDKAEALLLAVYAMRLNGS